jgi:hypothetical protein
MTLRMPKSRAAVADLALVADRREESADGDVREDEETGDDDRDPLGPAQQGRLHGHVGRGRSVVRTSVTRLTATADGLG